MISIVILRLVCFGSGSPSCPYRTVATNSKLLSLSAALTFREYWWSQAALHSLLCLLSALPNNPSLLGLSCDSRCMYHCQAVSSIIHLPHTLLGGNRHIHVSPGPVLQRLPSFPPDLLWRGPLLGLLVPSSFWRTTLPAVLTMCQSPPPFQSYSQGPNIGNIEHGELGAHPVPSATLYLWYSWQTLARTHHIHVSFPSKLCTCLARFEERIARFRWFAT